MIFARPRSMTMKRAYYSTISATYNLTPSSRSRLRDAASKMGFHPTFMTNAFSTHHIANSRPDASLSSNSTIRVTSSKLAPQLQFSFASSLSTTSHNRAKNNQGEGKSSYKTVLHAKNRYNADDSETHGQPLHRFESSHTREQAGGRLDLHQHDETHSGISANSYQVDVTSEQHADVYNHMPSVNLSACMQSQVPEPYGKTPTHMNMPGGVNRREHKYIQGKLFDISGKRELSTASPKHPSTAVDEHGNPTYKSAVEKIIRDPCPQGIQGEDCAQFKLWLSNCLLHGDVKNCEVLANEYIAGRKTLAQLFMEYDMEIKKVATSKVDSVSASQNAATTVKVDESTNQEPVADAKLNRVARLKIAVRDYGSTVMVFHVTISLASLGLFYMLVASNIDVLSILEYFNISLGAAKVSVGTASTFAVAYAVHKVFAPVRIGITLTCAPLIVKALRARGILKMPKPPVTPP